MNPAALLALISDLYLQIEQLTRENQELKKKKAAEEARPAPPADTVP